MLFDNDVQETKIDEKYIFQQKTEKNFYVCTVTFIFITKLRFIIYSIFAFLINIHHLKKCSAFITIYKVYL